MAIVIKTFQSSINLRMAYNNDILEFYSNDSNRPATYADVSITEVGAANAAVTVRLYPNPKGEFFMNLQPYIAALINKRYFEDTLNPAIGGLSVDNYLYDYTQGTIYKAYLNISVPGASYTSQEMWVLGVRQLGDYTVLDNRQYHLLSRESKTTINQYYLKYWQGYPFDISMFNGNNVLSNTSNYKLKNKTNLLDMSWQINKAGNVNFVSRLIFSDGRTDETLEDILPLEEGYNKLVWYKDSETEVNAKTIHLEKVPYKCGVYFKWLNALGGYNYWLFENTYSVDRSTKQLGELQRDNDNLNKTLGRTIQLGKESQDTIKVVAELLANDERMIVEGLIDSPKIYMFTGQPFARNNSNHWVEVTLKTSNVRVKNPKQPLTNFAFDFELPNRYIQTL